jgi:hypothetical protein
MEERMEALEEAMQSGNIPLMLVACRTLRKEVEQRPGAVVRHLMSAEASKGFLQGLCLCISSNDEACYREASVVLVSCHPPTPPPHHAHLPGSWCRIAS